MSKFEVTDKAIVALWDGLALDLQKLTAPRGQMQAVLKMARRDFFRMLANFPQRLSEKCRVAVE